MSTKTAFRPLHRWAPPSQETLGDIAAGVGADLGLTPDAEQRWLLDQIYAEKAPGIPAAFEVCVVAPRQNLKSATLEIAALTDLFVFGVELAVWTAHEFKTARKSFEDMRKRILANPDYAERADFRDSHGEEAIFLDTDERLEFHARSGGSGRGFTCGKLTLDEAMYLQDGDLGALGPTLVTIPDAQVRYGSSAGKLSSSALRALRKRGRARTDPSLAYVEYGATPRACLSSVCTHAVGSDGCFLDDRAGWWEANCALWAGRITEEALVHQRGFLPPDEFRREFLSQWDDPPEDAGGVFGGLWLALADTKAERGARPVFGVSVAPDRSWAAVAVAWVRPDGGAQVMLADYRPSTDWVAGRLVELRGTWGGTVVASTTARGLVPGAVEPAQGEQALAHTGLDDAVTAGTVHHGNEPALNTAVRGARWKPYGDTRQFDRKGSLDISPLDAAALAVQALKSVDDLPPNIW